MKTPGASYWRLRYAIAPAMLMVSFAAAGRAEAQCAPASSPASPVNNTTVTCTGATIDTNGTTGYGSHADTGNTYNILSNASVAGRLDGLAFNGGTVNNSGTISANGAGGLGIDAFAYHVTNSGSIEANGTNGVALLSGGNSDLANTGTISANGADGIGISSTGILNAPSHLRRTGDGDKLRLHWSGKNRH